MTLRELIAKWREQAASEHLKASAEVKAWRNQRGLMLTQCADELEAWLNENEPTLSDWLTWAEQRKESEKRT